MYLCTFETTFEDRIIFNLITLINNIYIFLSLEAIVARVRSPPSLSLSHHDINNPCLHASTSIHDFKDFIPLISHELAATRASRLRLISSRVAM